FYNRIRHTRFSRDCSSDVYSSDLLDRTEQPAPLLIEIRTVHPATVPTSPQAVVADPPPTLRRGGPQWTPREQNRDFQERIPQLGATSLCYRVSSSPEQVFCCKSLIPWSERAYCTIRISSSTRGKGRCAPTSPPCGSSTECRADRTPKELACGKCTGASRASTEPAAATTRSTPMRTPGST